MFERILIATDGTHLADDLIEAAASLHRAGLREALLLHVFDLRHAPAPSGDLELQLRPMLEHQVERLAHAGVAASAVTRPGVPARDIHAVAEEWQASMLLIGSAGGGRLAGFPLGSTATALLHSAARPVLLLPVARLEEGSGEPGTADWRAGFLGHVLHPTDFSEGADRALLAVEALARRANPRVTLCHVQDEVRLLPHLADRLEEFDRVDRERLARLAHRLTACGATEVSCEVEHGRPIPVLLERTRAGDVTLAVAGCQGRGYVREVALGSVAGALARLARVPLLLVPRAR